MVTQVCDISAPLGGNKRRKEEKRRKKKKKSHIEKYGAEKYKRENI
jgi:hypothetical protein